MCLLLSMLVCIQTKVKMPLAEVTKCSSAGVFEGAGARSKTRDVKLPNRLLYLQSLAEEFEPSIAVVLGESFAICIGVNATALLD